MFGASEPESQKNISIKAFDIFDGAAL